MQANRGSPPGQPRPHCAGHLALGREPLGFRRPQTTVTSHLRGRSGTTLPGAHHRSARSSIDQTPGVAFWRNRGMDERAGGDERALSVNDAPGPPNVGAEFDAWVAPHLSMLWALAARTVGAAAAEDVVQETLLRAWQRRETYDPARGSARVWLVAVLLDRARRHRVRGRWPSAGVGDTDSATAVTASSDRVDIEQAVRRLPPRQRQVVALHYLADLPVTEVASLLHISEGAVKAQLFDARRNLRQALEADYDPHR